jgi:hypothetical protein
MRSDGATRAVVIYSLGVDDVTVVAGVNRVYRHRELDTEEERHGVVVIQ